MNEPKEHGRGASDLCDVLGPMVEAAGMVNLLNNGAASCVHSEGCHGVTQEHLARFAGLVRASAAPRWVPVTETLPPEHVTCAVRMRGDYIATAWAAYWHGARTDFAHWVFPHDSDEECADKITHWLALPSVEGLGA